MDVKIESSWKAQLQEEFDKPYFEQLTQFVRQEYASGTCYPPGRLIFNAFDTTPFNEVRVVILGQDPYHGPGQAHGLCFSVNDGIPFPPSLQNIFKEIQAETGAPIPQSGNLTRWARQGVFLLNTCERLPSSTRADTLSSRALTPARSAPCAASWATDIS